VEDGVRNERSPEHSAAPEAGLKWNRRLAYWLRVPCSGTL
jgi:hypothetical protein